MKSGTLLIAASILLSGLASAGPYDADHKPIHGGILTTVRDVDYELVVNPTTLRLYVRDHGNAVDVSKASAKLTLLTSAEKQEIDLKPSGDKLEAAGAFKVGSGTKVIAVISVGSKPSTARFVLK